MKRLKLVIIILLALPLSGCIKETNLSDKQSDEVAEYMAGELLENDEYYDQRLISVDTSKTDSLNEAAVTNAPSQVTTGNAVASDSSDNTVSATKKNYTLAEVIGNKNFQIKFSTYKIAETYPENSNSAYFTIEPREGYQLLVASYTVENITGKEKTLDLSDKNISYKLEVDKDTTYDPLLTLLENDLQFVDIKVNGGNSKKVLLIFEVSKNDNLSNINLTVKNGNKSNSIKIK
jgi:hypothetical protein